MLKRLINVLRGSVRLEVTGAFPERLLNLCAQKGIQFWNVEWLEPTRLRLTVTRQGSGPARALGEKVQCTVTPAGRSLTVEVEGNQSVTTAEILTELRRQGLGVGAYGPGLDADEVGRRALMNLPGLSWLSVNLHGTRAEVLVREAVETPESVDGTELGDIVARASGIITGIDALSGEARFAVGDTVVEGDVLISGSVVLDAPMYSERENLGTMEVRAQGQVYARTWRTLTAALPLEAPVKAYTGEEHSRWALTLFGRRIDFFGKSGISFPEYDKISRTWTLTLPGGREMPLAFTRETCRAYTLESAPVETAAARALLEEELLAALRESVGEGEILNASFAAAERDGLLTVTLQAECTEEIGRFVPREHADFTQENEADS